MLVAGTIKIEAKRKRGIGREDPGIGIAGRGERGNLINGIKRERGKEDIVLSGKQVTFTRNGSLLKKCIKILDF